MSVQKSKNEFYCVGCSHRSATTKIYGDIICKGSKVPVIIVQFVIEKNR